MKAERFNITSACKFCQLKKLKCIEQRPCAQCIKRNVTCEPSDKKKKRGPALKSKVEYLKIHKILNHKIHD